ncbi:hypothetical protein GPECTOR_40g536 [Gonium pectorale]|uniref:Uncharacterized protein n=1 Tax=Gonium pectorale TaxID=33097 RepID=A0A150GAD5_GONPE|nr:hypothetical protein GPECTOR_40g536 [Gonium pectorale]|eukprot:KXZ46802.1 hypothetical protein GPECTOR_40g536 [Gonium pectorale]
MSAAAVAVEEEGEVEAASTRSASAPLAAVPLLVLPSAAAVREVRQLYCGAIGLRAAALLDEQLQLPYAHGERLGLRRGEGAAEEVPNESEAAHEFETESVRQEALAIATAGGSEEIHGSAAPGQRQAAALAAAAAALADSGLAAFALDFGELLQLRGPLEAPAALGAAAANADTTFGAVAAAADTGDMAAAAAAAAAAASAPWVPGVLSFLSQQGLAACLDVAQRALVEEADSQAEATELLGRETGTRALAEASAPAAEMLPLSAELPLLGPLPALPAPFPTDSGAVAGCGGGGGSGGGGWRAASHPPSRAASMSLCRWRRLASLGAGPCGWRGSPNGGGRLRA